MRKVTDVYRHTTCCHNGHVIRRERERTSLPVGTMTANWCGRCLVGRRGLAKRWSVPPDASPDEMKALAILFDGNSGE